MAFKGIESMTDVCRTRLLPDLPATHDALGAHDKVAQAFSDMVLEEDGGRSVALEGTWGSGKSTVVNLVRQKLSHDNVLVVVFDAWAHQGDPLRRTFLERLIAELRDRKWVNPRKWQRRLDELAMRTKVQTTDKTPLLKKGGAAFGLATLMAPFGLMIFDWQVPWYVRVMAGVLVLGPILVVVGGWMIARRERRRFSIGDFLFFKDVTKTVTTTTETPDPTSLEFAKTFREVVEEAFSEGERRLVLIIDNLDRVAHHDARTIWSTLQVFFDPEAAAQTWRSRTWLLLPYDRQGIQSVWDGRETGQGATAASFLDKTFQVRLEVPPPVFSRWSKLLRDLLASAMPDHDPGHENDAFQRVQWVYDRYRRSRERRVGDPSESATERAPTPRELTLFVNDLGSMHRQWHDTYPLHQVAYYVLLRRDGRDVISELRAGDLPEAKLAAVLAANIKDTLASLAFNASVDDARQLLFEEPIRGALESGDAEEFQELVGHWENRGAWLGRILEPSMETWMKEAPSALANAAHVLVHSGVYKELHWLPALMQKYVPQISTWNQLGSDVGRGIAAMFRIAPSADVLKCLVAALERAPIDDSEPESKRADLVRAWVDAVISFRQVLSEPGANLRSDFMVRVPGSAGAFLEACKHLVASGVGQNVWASIGSEAAEPQISEAVKNLAESGQPSGQLASVVEVIVHSAATVDMKPFVSAASNRLSDRADRSSAEVSSLLEALWRLAATVPEAQTALDSIGKDGYADHHLAKAVGEGHEHAIVMCVLTILRARPKGEPPPERDNSHAGHAQLGKLVGKPSPEFLARFDVAVERYVDRRWYGSLLKESEYARPIATALLRRLIDADTAAEVFDPEFVVGTWRLLRSELGDDFSRLAVRLVRELRITEALQNQPFAQPAAGLYAALLEAIPEEDPEYVDWLRSGLGQIGADSWESALKDPTSELVQLTISLVRAGAQLDLRAALADALVSVAEDVAGGGWDPPSEVSDRLSALIRGLRADTRKSFRGQLREVAGNRGGSLTARFFELFGHELRNGDTLREDHTLMERLFIPILRERNVIGIKWLRDVLKDDAQLLETFPAHHVEFFKERIAGLAQEGGADLEGPLVDLAEVAGVDLQRPQDGDQTGQSVQDDVADEGPNAAEAKNGPSKKKKER